MVRFTMTVMASCKKCGEPIGACYCSFLKRLKKSVRKDYGKRCEDFNLNCPVCQRWLMIDLLEDYLDERNSGIQYEKN